MRNSSAARKRIAARAKNSHCKNSYDKPLLATFRDQFPNYLQAISGLGLLGVTIYALFYSGFSKAVEASLIRENHELVLTNRNLSDENGKLESILAGNLKKLGDVETDLERKTLALSNKQSELIEATRDVVVLRSEKRELSDELRFNRKEFEFVFGDLIAEDFERTMQTNVRRKSLNKGNDDYFLAFLEGVENDETLSEEFMMGLSYTLAHDWIDLLQSNSITDSEIDTLMRLRAKFNNSCSYKEWEKRIRLDKGPPFGDPPRTEFAKWFRTSISKAFFDCIDLN